MVCIYFGYYINFIKVYLEYYQDYYGRINLVIIIDFRINKLF